MGREKRLMLRVIGCYKSFLPHLGDDLCYTIHFMATHFQKQLVSHGFLDQGKICGVRLR